jgi:hypothetical protein
VYTIVQLALATPALASVHTFVLGVNDPLPMLLKLTVPVGVLVGTAALSVTVAVHVVDVVAAGVEGEQDSAVVVVRAVKVICVVPDAGPCAESPG